MATAATAEPMGGATPTHSIPSAPGSMIGSPREGEDAPGDLEVSPGSQVQEERDVEEVEEEEGEAGTLPVPQVTIGEDGQIVIKESR